MAIARVLAPVLGMLTVMVLTGCLSDGEPDNNITASGAGQEAETTATPEVSPNATPSPEREEQAPTPTHEPTSEADGRSGDRLAVLFAKSELVMAYNLSDLPASCTPDMIETLLQQFADHYNARDIEGIISLMQYESEYQSSAIGLTPYNDEGDVAFQRVQIQFSADSLYLAETHDELREILDTVFTVANEIQPARISVSPARYRPLTGDSPSGTSERHAIVDVDFDRWSDGTAIAGSGGKGAIDCDSATIIFLYFGG
jgi:hypothetical protein